MGIPSTSASPERDFPIVRLFFGGNHAKLSPETLDNIFKLREAFEFDVVWT